MYEIQYHIGLYLLCWLVIGWVAFVNNLLKGEPWWEAICGISFVTAMFWAAVEAVLWIINFFFIVKW